MELVLCSILSYFLAVPVNAKEGLIRIDHFENYWKYQDIQKALKNKDRKSWIFYRSYSENTNGSEHSCVNANVEEKKAGEKFYRIEQGYTYSKGDQNQTVTVKILAIPFEIMSPYARKQRGKDNAMNVTKAEGGGSGRTYQLIYSDYKKCDILRVLGRNSGRDCELYLHDNAVDGGVPKKCKRIYGDACGKEEPSYTQQVYYPWCKRKIEGPIETPSAETTQEEVRTTTTLPPGC